MIKPFVHGLVHSTSTADFVSDLAMGNLSIKRFQNFIFQILLEHAGIDFRQFKRQGASDTLWTEIEQVQKIRNRIVHRAEEVTPEDADLSISVAHSVLDEIFPALISGLGLHLHEGIRVCNDYLCKLRPVLSSEIIALLRKKNKNG